MRRYSDAPRQNNPILTGEAGVGKTAVVEGSFVTAFSL